jgi:hypothetical protein
MSARCLVVCLLPLALLAGAQPVVERIDPWVVYPGGEKGPGKDKHVVLISGDEEYRSEEALPQLGKILARHHGFKCTVLFAIDKKDGTIKPDEPANIPGLKALKSADLMVIFTRFRNLPDEQMKHIIDYVESGKPIVGIRTATHAFNLPGSSKYARWSWANRDKGFAGGFGRQVLGETWISHHGGHGSQSTRGIIAADARDHPILKGIRDGNIWGPTDVYGVRLPLPGDCKPLVLGEVVDGMKPDDKPLEGKKNDPMMPIAWVKTWSAEGGKKARIFTSTMGSSQDMESEGFRRLLVNACYWCTGLEERIADRSNVEIVGDFKATPFGNNRFKKGLKPADYALK